MSPGSRREARMPEAGRGLVQPAQALTAKPQAYNLGRAKRGGGTGRGRGISTCLTVVLSDASKYALPRPGLAHLDSSLSGNRV